MPHGRNNFDFLRFLLASLVLLSHSQLLTVGSDAADPLALLTGGQINLGSFSVDAFFVLSGYLISQSWATRPDWRIFMAKRIRRIYPGFIVASAFGAFVVAPAFSSSAGVAWTRDFLVSYGLEALQLRAAVPGPAFVHNPAAGLVNASLWSIPYEFWCYVGVMLAGLAGALRRPAGVLAALVAALGVSLAFAVTGFAFSGGFVGRVLGYPPFWARLLPYFLAGMVFYAGRDFIVLNLRGAALSVGLLTIGAVVPHGLVVALPLAAAYLLFWFAALPVPGINLVARYGDLSYGIYLYAFPIQQMLVATHPGRLTTATLFVLSWPLSIMAAAASWHLVERRFMVGAGPKRSAAAIRPSA